MNQLCAFILSAGLNLIIQIRPKFSNSSANSSANVSWNLEENLMTLSANFSLFDKICLHGHDQHHLETPGCSGNFSGMPCPTYFIYCINVIGHAFIIVIDLLFVATTLYA